MKSRLYFSTLSRFAAFLLSVSFLGLVLALPFEAAAQSLNNNSPTAAGTLNPAAPTATAVTGAAVCTVQLLGDLGFSLASVGLSFAGNAPGGLFTHAPADVQPSIATGISNNFNLGINISELFQNQFLGCIARTIARAALQQMAISTINWINSGFQGSPSFVQNYDQFFANVADQTAGSFIQGSNLAFLCSPFQLQVRIAVAQAYASREAAQQCTLSQVTNNIQGFMDNFSQGGWPAFLSFTTTPTNNPFGAFVGAQAQLASQIASAQNTQRFDLQLSGGFLSFQQEQNCQVTPNPPPASPGKSITQVQADAGETPNPNEQGPLVGQALYRVCDKVNVTPGTAISQSLDKALGSNEQSLVDAKYFDEIINALISQLIQNTLYSGLSNLSQGQGYGYNNFGQVSNSALTNIIDANLPVYEGNAQHLMSIEQQNIDDINAGIALLQKLQNCRAGIPSTSTTTLSLASSTSALTSDEQQNLLTLQTELASHQQAFDTASSSITILENYKQQLAKTTDVVALQALISDFSTKAANNAFIGTGQINDAEENRSLLIGKLGPINSATQSALDKCNASQTP